MSTYVSNSEQESEEYFDDERDILVCGPNNEEMLETFTEHFESELILAIDCEGVNLGRKGTIELVQVSTPHMDVLFDVQGVIKTSKIVLFLKKLLEDSRKIKIMFDCRMDADALFHHLGITLKNVHDAQVYDMTNSCTTIRPNLKQCLLRYGISITTRDSNVYASNFRYWATRPLTQEMKTRAVGDVNQLFALREQQLESMSNDEQFVGKAKSDNAAAGTKDALVATVMIRKSKIGLFIGKGGSNLRSLEALLGCTFKTHHADSFSLPVHVYASDKTRLDRALLHLNSYK